MLQDELTGLAENRFQHTHTHTLNYKWFVCLFSGHWHGLNVCGLQKMYMLKSNHQPGDIRRQGGEKQVSPECGISQDQCLDGITRLPGAAFQFPPWEITVRSSRVVLFSKEVARTLCIPQSQPFSLRTPG